MSLRVPYPISAIHSPFPTFSLVLFLCYPFPPLLSLSALGGQLLPMAVFLWNWSSLGGSRAPQPLLSKAISGPRTPGCPGKDSLDAAKGPALPLPSAYTPSTPRLQDYLGLAVSGQAAGRLLKPESLKTPLKSKYPWLMLELQAEQPHESCPHRWRWCPGTWDSFTTCTLPPGLVGVGKEGHPTQPVSHPFFLQTSGTVVLSPSWSTSMEALTWKGQAT